MLPGVARAGEFELEAGLGVGITSLGERRATGGMTLQPSVALGWRFAEWGSLHYRNAISFFNLKDLRWIGVIDVNAAVLGIHHRELTLELGPSLHVFAVPLCADTWCQREHGLAPALHLGATLSPAPESRLRGRCTLHTAYIPGIAWSGISISIAVEGVYRF
ncbi:hypothetical protein [Sorangium sp. So ce381]|uniref:hypothetical protein n=1 Tax=Sorangium sp. So ce381 TaxID=3133307 RepID=UPI003F5AF277